MTTRQLQLFGIVFVTSLSVYLLFYFGQRLTVRRHMNAAFLTEGIVIANSAKMQLDMHYMETGQMPSSNAEAGLPAPYDFVGQALVSLQVSEGGVLTLMYNERSGVDGGVIHLRPDLGNPVVGPRWECTTPSYKGIQKLLPNCRYVRD